MKAGAHFQQAADAPFHLYHPAGRRGDPRENFEQRALAGAVAPDNAQRLALRHAEGDIVQRQDRLTGEVEGVFLPDARVRVWLPAGARPPALQVAGEAAGANNAQLVALGEMFNGNDGFGQLIFLL